MFLFHRSSRLRTNTSLKSLLYGAPRQIAGERRCISSSAPSFSSSHTVTLDNETLYLDEKLARALGWTPEAGVDGVKLSLHGWKSHYFVVTKAGTDSGETRMLYLCFRR
jgi:hypothetical protein